jgi:hypothetical protein
MALQRSRIGLVVTLSLVIGVVAWGLYGSGYHGGIARPGGIVILRWCWLLLVSLAVPLGWAAYRLRKAEKRIAVLETTLDTFAEIEGAKRAYEAVSSLVKPGHHRGADRG